jgi:hypothetical protein
MEVNLPEEVVQELNKVIAPEFDVSELVSEDYECFVLFFIALGVGNVRLGLEKNPELTLTHMMDRYFLGDQSLQ